MKLATLVVVALVSIYAPEHVFALFGKTKIPPLLTYKNYRAPLLLSDPTTINKTILEDWRHTLRKRDRSTVCKKRFYAIDEFKYNRLETNLWAIEYGKQVFPRCNILLTFACSCLAM